MKPEERFDSFGETAESAREGKVLIAELKAEYERGLKASADSMDIVRNAEMLDTALACDGTAWAAAITKAGTNRPCDLAASALDRLGGLTFDGKVYRERTEAYLKRMHETGE